MNIGSAPIDLGGYRVVDQQDGGPRADEQVVFEAGTTLAPGEHLLVLADLDELALPGQQSDCAPATVTRCYQAPWGLSNSSGDSLFLLAPSGEVLLRYDYPAGAVDSGAWGRVPDGTGEFVNTQPTYGAANVQR